MAGGRHFERQSLIVPNADLQLFERRIGEQLIVSGRLVCRVRGDTASFNLVEVELLNPKFEPE